MAWAGAAGLVLGAGCEAESGGPCLDGDGDGYGANNHPACLFAGTDCADDEPRVNPGAPEICGNAIDEDCAGGDPECPQPRCDDWDEDGYGDGPLCQGPDCDDHNNTIHPGAAEICSDGLDNDCRGGDRACPPSCTDRDLDGYGDGAGCLGADCDDADGAINPGADETCGDGVDNDCAGGDETCLPRCGDGWLSLGTVPGTEMITLGDVRSPDPVLGEPWILLSEGVVPGSTGTAWIGWSFDAGLARCVTDVSVFVWAYDDSTMGTGADVSFDAGDGTPGERIANIDRDETWYGATLAPGDHLECDAVLCFLWIVVSAEVLDFTHIRDADAAIFLDWG